MSVYVANKGQEGSTVVSVHVVPHCKCTTFPTIYYQLSVPVLTILTAYEALEGVPKLLCHMDQSQC